MGRVFTSQTIITPAPFVFAGPGDVVANALVWFGLRAYSLATVGSNVVRLRRDSDNVEQDFASITGGGLDIAGITAFKGAANLFVVSLYDQVPGHPYLLTSNRVTQATAAQQPSFNLSGIGSLPTMTFSAAASQFLQGASGFASVNQPLTHSGVGNYTNNGTQATMFNAANPVLFGFNGATPNRANMYAGVNVFATATDGAWHSVSAVYNGASSDLNVDGTVSTQNAGTNNSGGGTVYVGNSQFTQPFNGSIVEVGAWTIGFAPAQSSSISANAHAYWGF